MTFGELADIIGMKVDNVGGGVIDRGTDRVLIRGVSKVASAEDIANLPVNLAARVQPLNVKDLAEVGIGCNLRKGCAVENGEEAVLGTVMMLVGANSHIISLRMEKKLAELQKKLPASLEIRIQYARSEVVDRSIETVEHNLFEGAVLVVAVLLFLVGHWRAALIVENIVRVLGEKQRELGRRLTAKERLAAVHEAGEQVGSPMFFGVLIMLVYLAILALTGIEGKMFQPMAITVMSLWAVHW